MQQYSFSVDFYGPAVQAVPCSMFKVTRSPSLDPHSAISYLAYSAIVKIVNGCGMHIYFDSFYVIQLLFRGTALTL